MRKLNVKWEIKWPVFCTKPGFIISAGILILTILTICFFNMLVLFLYPPSMGYNKNCNIETLKIVTIIYGGILILVQIYLTNRRTKAAEDNLRILESGQVQERFKNAIDQLGHKSDTVNIGAIYTLHHIATDNSKFTKSVFDILCSYIRQTTLAEIYKSTYVKKPSIKIQNILNLLFKEGDERKTYAHLHANLSKSFLVGADLSWAIFNDANLNDVNFTDANLNHVQFSSSQLIFANFTNANLTSAYIRYSRLHWAILTDARIMGSNLYGSSFYNTNLDGVLLSDSMWFQTLKNSDCEGVDSFSDLYTLEEEDRKGRTCYRIIRN